MSYTATLLGGKGGRVYVSSPSQVGHVNTGYKKLCTTYYYSGRAHPHSSTSCLGTSISSPLPTPPPQYVEMRGSTVIRLGSCRICGRPTSQENLVHWNSTILRYVGGVYSMDFCVFLSSMHCINRSRRETSAETARAAHSRKRTENPTIPRVATQRDHDKVIP